MATGLPKVDAAIEQNSTGEGGEVSGKETQSQMLVELADEDVTYFHTPEKDAYAQIEIDGHLETYAIRSKGYKEWLGFQFYKRERKAPSSQALQDALNAIIGRAKYESDESEVYLRFAEYKSKIYMDLCNANWQIVEIGPEEWKVITSAKSPVKFRRSPSMMSLPTPKKGKGDISLLENYLNVSEASFILIKTWIAAAMRPGFPFPILILKGEQGAAKTTAARIIRLLVDPNKVLSKSCPRDVRDLYISAYNSWITSYDNVSYLKPWLSDDLCSLATGGGFTTRKLFADAEEVTFSSKRPIILNGIGSIASRGDLLGRALIATLEEIPDDKRKPEREFYESFDKDHAAIFSGLLDVVSAGLKKIDSIKLKELPRMADFAAWAVACESALGIEEDAFLMTYTENRTTINSTILEASVIAQLFFKMQEKNHTFAGTVGELLHELEGMANQKMVDAKTFPKDARALRWQIDRINPSLRQVGVSIKFGKHGRKGTPVTVEYVGPKQTDLDLRRKSPSRPSPPSPPLKNQGETRDGHENSEKADRHDRHDRHRPSQTPVSASSSKGNGLDGERDGGDGGDGKKHHKSKSLEGVEIKRSDGKEEFEI